jgi:ABC-2 type transport system ATP-binding protein
VAEAPAIEMTGLSKTYRGGVVALSGLDLRLEHGEVLGYLGPNGAGKSTTLRLLLDLIRPTAGGARILGLDVRVDGVAVRKRVGYVPGDLRLSDRLTGGEQLDSLARLRGASNARLRDELCDRFGVVLDRPIRDLSKGNRQKLGLVQGFMHRPEVLVLDEPTSGLDPLLQEEFRHLLRETADDGRAVFLSSHSLDEVQHVADRVAIIRAGRLVDVDSVEGLREHALRRVTIHFVDAADATLFAALPAVHVDAVEGNVLRLSVPEAAMDAVVKVAARSTILDFVSEPADLEEIFLTRYREVDDGP